MLSAVVVVLCVSPAGFRRPVVIFGPVADAATERLAKEMPDQFVIASMLLLLCGGQHEFHYHPGSITSTSVCIYDRVCLRRIKKENTFIKLPLSCKPLQFK